MNGDKITICGVEYEIINVDDHFDIDTHFGQVDYLHGKIILNNNMSDSVRNETLCHEILHAMLVYIGRSDLSEDETFVCALGNAINQTFRIKDDAICKGQKVSDGTEN